MRRACLGRALSDSNSSINYFDFSVFSVIWGICFSLEANPKRPKNIAFWHTFGTGSAPAFIEIYWRSQPDMASRQRQRRKKRDGLATMRRDMLFERQTSMFGGHASFVGGTVEPSIFLSC